jgi:hypothetical protein
MSIQDTADEVDDQASSDAGSPILTFPSEPSKSDGLKLMKIFSALSPRGRSLLTEYAENLQAEEKKKNSRPPVLR